MTAPESRWRPIDPQGNVDPKPAPETPDDPSEGETGPPEVDGDAVIDITDGAVKCGRCERITSIVFKPGMVDTKATPDGGICGGRFAAT